MMYSYRTWGAGHNNQRIITADTLAFIERWELFIDHWYEDGKRPDGSIIWSCMFGHAEGGDNPPFKYQEGQKFTLWEARETLNKDIDVKARWVDVRIPADKVPLTTYMYGALVSLVYQFGQGRLDQAQEKFPLVQQLLDGNYVDAAITMLSLNYKKDGTISKGHTLRRASEVGFFMTRKDL